MIRTLTTQLTELKRRHRDELTALKQALEAAHGENLELRRRLGHREARRETTAPPPLTASLTDATASALPAQTP